MHHTFIIHAQIAEYVDQLLTRYEWSLSERGCVGISVMGFEYATGVWLS